MKNNQLIKDSKILFVNNFLQGGIKEFGVNLSKQFNKVKTSIEYTEMIPNWNGLFGIFKLLLSRRGNYIVYNIGFTSFGNSHLRNFLHFLFIYMLSNMSYDIRLILHDSPEIMEKDMTIQSLNRLVVYVSKLIILLLRKTKIFVVSVRMKKLLENRYNLYNVKYYPFPCDSTVEHCTFDDGPKVVFTIGHILPYKGYEILSEIKEINNELELVCIGDKSSSLKNDRKYTQYYENLKWKLIRGGVKLTGYLETSEVQNLLCMSRPIGLLPYRSMSGSSASAAFFVERNIPIITSDLDEFIKLRELGACVFPVRRDASEFSDIIRQLFENEDIMKQSLLADSQYCEKYNYLNLLRLLISNEL